MAGPQMPPVAGPQTPPSGVSPLTAGNEYSLIAPGDQASCHATAKALRALAGSLAKAHRGQADDADIPDSTLGGHTGDAFRKGAKQVKRPIHELRQACLTGATALDQLARDMHHLQQKFDHVRHLARVDPAFLSADGNYLIRPVNGAFNACTADTPAGWDEVAAAYVEAIGYQVGAQKAYLTAIGGTTYSAVDADTVLANGLNNGSGYTPTPAPKDPHPQHHPKHPPSPSTTPAPTPTPAPTGGGGNPGAHVHSHGLPATHHHGKHGEKLVASLDDDKRDLKPITAAKHEQLEKHLTSLTRQSQSLQHRIDVMQEAIKADPTNVDNPLLHQEVTYLNHQLHQHQAQIQAVTDQLNAPVFQPHHGGSHGGSAVFEQVDKLNDVELGKTWQSASVLDTPAADVAAPVTTATPPTAQAPSTTDPAAGA